MKWFLGSIGGFVLLLVGFLIWSSFYGPAPAGPRPLIGEKMQEQESPHITQSQPHEEYNSNPPTSGPHIGDGVAGAGIKTEQVSDELVVHSLEHGAAVLWYKSDLPQEQIAEIKAAYDAARVGKKIMIPRVNLDVPVALVSWGYILKLDTIDASKITEFIVSNSSRAPENAPI